MFVAEVITDYFCASQRERSIGIYIMQNLFNYIIVHKKIFTYFTKLVNCDQINKNLSKLHTMHGHKLSTTR